MKQPNARIYLSRHLMRLFGERLWPIQVFRLGRQLLLSVSLMDHLVADFRPQDLRPHPTAIEPPWEHQEVLLRTWPELLATGEPYGL